MFQYRQVLVRLRQGDSEREIARARLHGPRQARGRCARWPAEQGWLDAAARAARRRGDRRRARSGAARAQHRLQRRAAPRGREHWLAQACGAAPSTPRCGASTATAAATRPSYRMLRQPARRAAAGGDGAR